MTQDPDDDDHPKVTDIMWRPPHRNPWAGFGETEDPRSPPSEPPPPPPEPGLVQRVRARLHQLWIDYVAP